MDSDVKRRLGEMVEVSIVAMQPERSAIHEQVYLLEFKKLSFIGDSCSSLINTLSSAVSMLSPM